MFAFIKKLFGVNEVVTPVAVDAKVEAVNTVPYKVEAPVVAAPAPVVVAAKKAAPAKKAPAAKKAPVAKKPAAKTQKSKAKPAV